MKRPPPDSRPTLSSILRSHTLASPTSSCPAAHTHTPHRALQTRLRKAIYDGIRAFICQHSLVEPSEVLDLGCSVGLSSCWLAAEWPQAQVTGLDLSPYFLAVAELRERQLAGGAG